MRDVRDAGQHRAQRGVVFLRLFFQSIYLLPKLPSVLHQFSGILFVTLQPRNLFGGTVALGLECFHAHDGPAALRVQLRKAAQHLAGIQGALAQLLLHEWQVITYECEVEHKQTTVPESCDGRQQSSLATHLPLPLHYRT